jgi:hypothetical protein
MLGGTVTVGLLAAPVVYADQLGSTLQPSLTILVDDTRTVGVVGDRVLSLAEGVQLAGGALPLASLSADERSHVNGTRTPAGAKLIEVVLGKAAAIQADAPMPLLAGLENTVIDGGAAVLSPGADGSTPFVVASSRLTIRNLTVTGFGSSVDITPRTAGAVLQDIVLDRLDLTNSSMNVNINGSGGTLRRIAVTHSRIAGVPGGTGNLVGVNIVGQSGASAGLVEDVVVSDNWFGDHMLERVQLVGVQAVGGLTAMGTVAPGTQVRNVTVSRNVFTTCPDPCVLGYSALALGGQITGAGMQGINVIDNVMPVNGSGVILIAGYTLGGASTDGSTLANVVVKGNRIYPVSPSFAGKCVGISIAADYTDFHVGLAVDSTIRDVVVAGNHVTGCNRGLVLSGTAATEAVSGSVQRSAVIGVQVRGNTFDWNGVAFQAVGVGLTYTRAFGNNPTSVGAGAAVLEGNSVRGVLLDRNTFAHNDTALFVAGAAVQDTYGHLVANNTVADVTSSRTTFIGNGVICRIVDDVRTASAGVNSGNSVTGTSCPRGTSGAASDRAAVPGGGTAPQSPQAGGAAAALAATGGPPLAGWAALAMAIGILIRPCLQSRLPFSGRARRRGGTAALHSSA